MCLLFMLKKEKGQAVPAHRHLTHQGPETQNKASAWLGHQLYRLGLPEKGQWPSCGSLVRKVRTPCHHTRVLLAKDVEAPPASGLPPRAPASRRPGVSLEKTRGVSTSALAPLQLPLGPVRALQKSRAGRTCVERARGILRNWLTDHGG